MIMWSWETWGEHMSNINFSEAPRVLICQRRVVSWFTSKPTAKQNIHTYKQPTNNNYTEAINRSDRVLLGIHFFSWKFQNDSNPTSPLAKSVNSRKVELPSGLRVDHPTESTGPWIMHSYKLEHPHTIYWFPVCIHLVHTYFFFVWLFTYQNFNVFIYSPKCKCEYRCLP